MKTKAPKVLALSNLFPHPWNPTKATFNHEIFKRLAKTTDLTLMVPVSVYEVIKHPLKFLHLRFSAKTPWPWATFFVYFHLPRVLIRFNDSFMFVSLLLQHPILVLVRKWDVLFASWLFPDAVCLQKVSKLRQVPLVAMALGSDVNVTFKTNHLKKKVLSLVSYAYKTILVSQALRKILVDNGILEQRTRVVYTGVDKTVFRSIDTKVARQNLGFSKEDKVVLFVGNLIPTKGCIELVQAIEVLRKTTANLKLVFVGDGPCKAEIMQKFATRIANKEIHFAGKVLPENLPIWFGIANVFALPSYQEGVPNVVLEAMACGVSIVSTNVGGIPEVLHSDCGLMVSAKTVEPLALAIETLLNNPKDPSLIQKYATQFDWDHCVQSIHETINDARS
jgi:glycosyltransferase involved in cell wall biosynthesis